MSYLVIFCEICIQFFKHAEPNLFKALWHINKLTPIEKSYICFFVDDNTPTYEFRCNDGNAMSLTNKGILVNSGIKTSPLFCCFLIQPWILRYFNRKANLLNEGRSKEIMERRNEESGVQW